MKALLASLFIFASFFIIYTDSCQSIKCKCSIRIDENSSQMTQSSSGPFCDPMFKCDAKAKLFYVEATLPDGTKAKLQLSTPSGLLENDASATFGFKCIETAGKFNWNITKIPTFGYTYLLMNGQTFTPPAKGMTTDYIYCL